MSRVLLTGATGFVGGRLYPALVDAGHEVTCASRSPLRARAGFPQREWRRFDVTEPSTYPGALDAIDVVIYLVHSIGDSSNYEDVERDSAERVAEAAGRSGVNRIIYLGGVEPEGEPSRHLRGRLATGVALREGPVSAIELRAGMIIGAGSESWRLVRDMTVRLPIMVAPRWLSTPSRPVAIDDVVAALVHAVGAPDDFHGCFGLPGPETMTGQQIMMRAAALSSYRPRTVRLNQTSPRVSRRWIRFFTGVDPQLAKELIMGMSSSLVGSEPEYWPYMQGHERVSFDEAGRRAFAREQLPLRTRVVERLIGVLHRKTTE